MSDVWALLAMIALLGANAFFVGAEFALISARRDRLEALGDEGVSGAATVLRASEHLSMMLAAAQLGITLCSLALGSLGEPAVAHLLEAALEPVGIPEAVLQTLGFVIALLIVTVLHIVVGEMVPKNIAIAGPERTSLWLVPPLVAFLKVTRPVIVALNWVANHVLRLFGVEPVDEKEAAYTPSELADMLSESRREGLLDASQTQRLTQTLSSAEHTVADVMVPLERVTVLPAEPTVGAVEDAVARTGFSRYPVRGPGTELAGYLHVKDVLDLTGADTDPVPSDRVRVLPRLAVAAPVDEALATLRREGSHLGRAVGDDGATVGVVALEDLVEEYVGTVRDSTHVGRSGARS